MVWFGLDYWLGESPPRTGMMEGPFNQRAMTKALVSICVSSYSCCSSSSSSPSPSYCQIVLSHSVTRSQQYITSIQQSKHKTRHQRDQPVLSSVLLSFSDSSSSLLGPGQAKALSLLGKSFLVRALIHLATFRWTFGMTLAWSRVAWASLTAWEAGHCTAVKSTYSSPSTGGSDR